MGSMKTVTDRIAIHHSSINQLTVKLVLPCGSDNKINFNFIELKTTILHTYFLT